MIRNRQQTLMIARFMVRAEDFENRKKLLEIIKNTPEQAYLRLFLDYHGLQLLWSWMVDCEDPWLKSLILDVLEVLPVTNRTMLTESKVFEVVERWAAPPTDSPIDSLITLPPVILPEGKSEPVDGEIKENDAKAAIVENGLDSLETLKAETTADEQPIEPDLSAVKEEPQSDDKPTAQDITDKEEISGDKDKDTAVNDSATAEGAKEDGREDGREDGKEDVKEPTPGTDPSDAADGVKRQYGLKIKIKEAHSAATSTSNSPAQQEHQERPEPPSIYGRAMRILNTWKDLKEGFKIPRLVRQKRKDDEREADVMAREEEDRRARGMPGMYPPRGPDSALSAIKRHNFRDIRKNYTERRNNGQYNGYNFNLGEPAPPQEPAQPKLSKEEHRAQFEKEVMRKQYEEAMKQYQLRFEQYVQMMQQYMAHGIPPPMPPPNQPPTLDAVFPSDGYTPQPVPPPVANGYDLAVPTAEFTTPVNAVDAAYEYPAQGCDEQVEFYTVDELEQYDDEYTYMDSLLNCDPKRLIECTGPENQLTSDEAAVISTDYGVEYVPANRAPTKESFPSPATYFDTDGGVIKMTHPNCDIDYVAECALHLLGQPVSTPLPKYWRRATSRSGRTYYFHKKTGETRWTLPMFDGPPLEEPAPSTTSDADLADSVPQTSTPCEAAISAPTSTSHTPVAPIFSPAVQPIAPPVLTNGGASPLTQQQSIASNAFVTKPPANKHAETDARKRKNEEILNTHHKVRKVAKPVAKRKIKSREERAKMMKRFRNSVVEFIRELLNRYMRADVKVGRITSKDDFKFLCQKVSERLSTDMDVNGI